VSARLELHGPQASQSTGAAPSEQMRSDMIRVFLKKRAVVSTGAITYGIIVHPSKPVERFLFKFSNSGE